MMAENRKEIEKKDIRDEILRSAVEGNGSQVV